MLNFNIVSIIRLLNQWNPKYEDDLWRFLIRKIHKGECLPFLGAGISSPFLPLAKDLANTLAKEYSYPFKENSDNLSKVAKFVEIQYDKSLIREKICKIIEKVNRPDFTEYKDTPHAILSKIDFPLYVTTNYDYFMEAALKKQWKATLKRFL